MAAEAAFVWPRDSELDVRTVGRCISQRIVLSFVFSCGTMQSGRVLFNDRSIEQSPVRQGLVKQ